MRTYLSLLKDTESSKKCFLKLNLKPIVVIKYNIKKKPRRDLSIADNVSYV